MSEKPKRVRMIGVRELRDITANPDVRAFDIEEQICEVVERRCAEMIGEAERLVDVLGLRALDPKEAERFLEGIRTGELP